MILTLKRKFKYQSRKSKNIHKASKFLLLGLQRALETMLTSHSST
jgi:hypothetical protein